MSENSSSTPEQDTPPPSLLADILKSTPPRTENPKTDTQTSGVSSSDGSPSPSPRPPKEPISLATFMKLIGSLLFVSIVFFGSFLAYIAFNPEQAIFFVNTFNIDPKDIKDFLGKLVNGTFGFIMIIVSIIWIISLFRAFWGPKEFKRKRLLAWLTAGVIGILLFSILALWAVVFEVIGKTRWDNLDGKIIIYDQAQYANEQYRKDSQFSNTENLFGPIDILFDIRSNAQLLTEGNLVTIESFEIDFDGARCSNGKSSISGANPTNEQSLVCTFDEIKPYNIIGSYTVRDRNGDISKLPIALPSIEIRGLVNIRNQTNTRGQKIITLDATSLKKFGAPEWLYESTNKTVTESSITETVSSIPQRICLQVFQTGTCDRVFVLQDTDNKKIEGSISAIQDRTDSRLFQFSLSGITLNANEITNIEWLLDGQTVICNNGDEICSYTFPTYGTKTIKATLSVANDKKYEFETTVTVNEPLNLVRHIKVFNADGTLLNDEPTYDQSLRAFIIKNTIVPPEVLTFDARDVVSANPGYTLSNVLWKIDNGKEQSEQRGTKTEIAFNQPLRYAIDAELTFTKSIPGEPDKEEYITEKVIVDIERKSLMPRLEVTKTSDYVPSLVTVDASQSEAENGEIKKFIFDFGEGRAPAEGDAIQEYQYTKSGDKEITLTIIGENGDRASIKRTIVLKDQIKTIDFAPSVTPGLAGSTTDFEATGTNGQIEEYVWNFGDNTPVERGYQVSHSYATPGTYTITLTIVYTDGTQRSMKKTYEVSNP